MNGKLKILYVDHQPTSFERVKTLSSSLNIELIHVTRSKEAMDVANKNGFHLALIETDMLDHNGLETFALIKEKNPGIPIKGPFGENYLKFRGTDHESQDTPLLVQSDGMSVYPRPKASYLGQSSS